MTDESRIPPYPAPRVGLVDLDTSHPAAWVPILRDLGCVVAGVYDGGTVWPAGYAQAFAAQHAIPNVYTDLSAMAAEVDIAVLHSCNWDLHAARAAPFLAAGKAVLVDKPLAGCPRDLRQLEAWAAQGHRISGGSSLRWCEEVRACRAQPEETFGRIHTVFAGCSVDAFNYGIHAYSLLAGIFGPGARRARFLGEGAQQLVQVEWGDGRTGVVSIGAQDGYLPFYATVVTTRTVQHIQVDASRLYRSLLEQVLPYLSGQTAGPPFPFNVLAETEWMALAACKSRRQGGEWVPLDQLAESDAGYDGAAFAGDYKRSKLSA